MNLYVDLKGIVYQYLIGGVHFQIIYAHQSGVNWNIVVVKGAVKDEKFSAEPIYEKTEQCMVFPDPQVARTKLLSILSGSRVIN